MKRSIIFVPVLVLAILGLTSCGSDALSVSDVRSRVCAEGDACGIYMTIENSADEPDTLVGASSEVSDTCGLHTVEADEQGEMQMVPIENIPVPASGAVELKPGSLHVMCMALNRDLNDGDTFSVTLEFETADDVTVDVTARAEP